MEHKYLWQGGKLVSEYYDGKELEFFYDESGNPCAFSYKASSTATPVTYYYLTNLQGDIVGILDSSGTTVATYTYNAWGKLLSSTGDLASINPLRYRGYYYDAELEMYYLQSRYYDPEVGRFINADSYASTGQGILGYNMFAYCVNNPVNSLDPTGHSVLGFVLGCTAVLITFVGYISCVEQEKQPSVKRKEAAPKEQTIDKEIKVDSKTDLAIFAGAMVLKFIGDVGVSTGLVIGTIAAATAAPATGGLSIAPAAVFSTAFPESVVNDVGDVLTIAKGFQEYQRDGEFTIKFELPHNISEFVDFLINGPIKIYD